MRLLAAADSVADIEYIVVVAVVAVVAVVVAVHPAVVAGAVAAHTNSTQKYTRCSLRHLLLLLLPQSRHGSHHHVRY